jgi:hypothetical protein
MSALTRPIEIKMLRHARERLNERAPGVNLRALLEARLEAVLGAVTPGSGRYAVAGLTPAALPIVERPRAHGPLFVVTVLRPGSTPASDTRVLTLP